MPLGDYFWLGDYFCIKLVMLVKFIIGAMKSNNLKWNWIRVYTVAPEILILDGIYLVKGNNRNTGAMCQISSKSTIKTLFNIILVSLL